MLARTKENKTKLQLKTIETATNGGNKLVKLRQETIKTFLKKSSETGKYDVTFRGCLLNQSHCTEDGQERALQGPNLADKTSANRSQKDHEKTPKMGQTNEIDRNKKCATNQMTEMGQVTRVKEI